MWAGQETLARSIWFVDDKKFGSKGTTKIFSQISLCWKHRNISFQFKNKKILDPGVKWKSVSRERSVMHNQAVVDSKDERWRWICVLVQYTGSRCIFSRMFLFFFLLRSPLLVLVQQRVVNSANSALVKDCRWQSPSEKDLQCHPIQSYRPEKISNQIAILS